VAAIKKGLRPNTELDAALYDLMLTGVCEDDSVKDAYDLYRVAEHRTAMDAFSIAGATPEMVKHALAIDPKVTEAYRELFMDCRRFRNKLERISYAKDYPADAYGKEMVRAAVTAGLDYLLWAYGASDSQIDARSVIRQTMAEAYYRGMAHRGQSISSPSAKEAHKWWGTAVKNAELLERVDPRAEKQALEEIRIALERRDDTIVASDAPVPLNEILH
jgi:hypothetical protein